MKLTNKLGLPQPLVDAVANDSYTKGSSDISVTGLLKPPRIAALEAHHADEIEEDASDRIWSLMGQVVHGILERADNTGVAERRLKIEVEGWTVSGQMDRYIDGVLQDYKVVTVYKFKHGDVPEEYEQQLNCYAEILRQNGHPVKKLQIVGILRDWSKMEAMRESDNGYPQAQVIVRDVNMWPSETAKKFLSERVILHKQAKIKLPLCSDKDRWARPNVYAVMKKGRKSAVRLYSDKAQAEEHVGTDTDLSVTHRPGENIRCQSYCSVAKFCNQFKAIKKANEES